MNNKGEPIVKSEVDIPYPRGEFWAESRQGWFCKISPLSWVFVGAEQVANVIELIGLECEAMDLINEREKKGDQKSGILYFLDTLKNRNWFFEAFGIA